jgi:hypothetical protein
VSAGCDEVLETSEREIARVPGGMTPARGTASNRWLTRANISPRAEPFLAHGHFVFIADSSKANSYDVVQEGNAMSTGATRTRIIGFSTALCLGFINLDHALAQEGSIRERAPQFALPFPCDEAWRLTTRENHDPEAMKIDFYDPRERLVRGRRTPFFTVGRRVFASAPGRVVGIDPDNGEIEIDHGHGWFSLYLHMFLLPDLARPGTRSIEVGDYIGWNRLLGLVGNVGVGGIIGIPHLHFEQGYDSNGDGEVSFLTQSTERVVPQFEGQSFEMSSEQSPVVRSSNSCDVTFDTPAGSYQNSCQDCALAGDFLSCQCRDDQGSPTPTYMFLPCGGDIANCDGRLTCGACDPVDPIKERFVFRNENSKLCLGVDRASTEPGAQLKQFECDCSANQQWIVDDDRIVISGHQALVNVKSQLCTGVDGGSSEPDASIMQFACDQRPNQQWALEDEGPNELGEPTIRFKNASGLCMGVDGASTASDVQVKQFPCDGRINQRWVAHSPGFCST